MHPQAIALPPNAVTILKEPWQCLWARYSAIANPQTVLGDAVYGLSGLS